MLIDLYITYFLMLLLIIGFIQNKIQKESIFSLKNLFVIFAIAEIPYLYFLNANTQLIHPYVQSHIVDYEEVFTQHIILKMMFLCVALTTMSMVKPKSIILTKIFSVSNISRKGLLLSSLFLLLITIIVFYLFLDKVGGLLFLILNMSNKTLIVQGTGLYRNMYLITSLLSVGFYIHFLSTCKHISKMKLLFLMCLILLFFLILASSGERKNPILLLIYCLILWNFKISKIKLFTVKNIIMFLLLLFFAALAPVLRKHGSTEFYIDNPIALITDALPYIGEIFKRFSEIDISLFIYSHFKGGDDFWFGTSIVDFFTGFIPSQFYPNKPPLDEGVYIYALAHHYNVSPPTPFNEMIPVGWPLSRVTGGYVNFGVFGVIINAIIVGVVLKYFYVLLVKTKYSPSAMVMFSTLLATNFGITNAFVANNIVVLCLMIFFSLIIHFLFSRISF